MKYNIKYAFILCLTSLFILNTTFCKEGSSPHENVAEEKNATDAQIEASSDSKKSELLPSTTSLENKDTNIIQEKLEVYVDFDVTFDKENSCINDESIVDPENILISQQEFTSLIHEHTKDDSYSDMATEEELLETRSVNPKKHTTLIVFMAANNDLHPFAWKNIKQMELIGSNENINIIVQLNTPGYYNTTKRYIIKQGRRLLVQADGQAPTQKLNSGSPYTLIDCVDWAMKHYPADNLIVNFWDHGSGIWDPGSSKTINICDLFHVNKATNTIDLDRNIEYIQFVEESAYKQAKQRGICFDDTYKSYMTNQDLKFALSEIQNKILKGKKIDVVWFDACLMSMIEIADICKDHVNYLAASQDVEYAAGSNYQLVLNPFMYGTIEPRDFACHIVQSFEKAYQLITRDYTQSAVDLSFIDPLEANIHLVAQQLVFALQNQKNRSVIKILQQCKSRPLCTCFEEPSFIDLQHFFINLQSYLLQISLVDYAQELTIKASLAQLLTDGIELINKAVIANAAGSNLSHACGLSIYFPERAIFSSYPKCNFAINNSWYSMLTQYLAQNKF